MNDVQMTTMLGRMRAMEAMAKSSEATLQVSQGESFVNLLKQQMDKVNDLQNNSNSLRAAYEKGDPSANLIDVMLASQKATLSLQAMLQVRNKLVSAYQEIMNMQV